MSTRSVRIGIIGDFNANSPSHQHTNQALQHASHFLSIPAEWDWIATDSLSSAAQLAGLDALWIAPGSPYKNMEAALFAIRYARENDVPLIGTCGGFQHIVIEYARNVLGFAEAQHAEYDPNASLLFITPLSCSLVGQRLPIRLIPDSRACQFYGGATEIEEEYYCNFGLNPDYQAALDKGGLRLTGIDAQGEARVMELPRHRFFLGTLFVPQHQSTLSKPHPLIVSFLKNACG
jgi:CTP synthase (UTP-ammonia lyase)